MKNVYSILESVVSIFALFMAVVVAFYMIFLFSSGTLHFINAIPDIIGDSSGRVSSDEMKNIEKGMLHSIAFSIILLKAFRILIFYAKTFHLNIKYLVEISIIAPAIEILFNSSAYSYEILVLFGLFGLGNLIIYVLKFDTFQKIYSDKN